MEYPVIDFSIVEFVFAKETQFGFLEKYVVKKRVYRETSENRILRKNRRASTRMTSRIAADFPSYETIEQYRSNCDRNKRKVWSDVAGDERESFALEFRDQGRRILDRPGEKCFMERENSIGRGVPCFQGANNALKQETLECHGTFPMPALLCENADGRDGRGRAFDVRAGDIADE